MSLMRLEEELLAPELLLDLYTELPSECSLSATDRLDSSSLLLQRKFTYLDVTNSDLLLDPETFFHLFVNVKGINLSDLGRKLKLLNTLLGNMFHKGELH